MSLPNILVITSDEHNPKHLSCAGHPVVKTPNLDRLAAQGTRFDRAYCAQPICAPTRQTFITGLWSFEHGQYSNSHVFDKRHPTWAHHFNDAGYHTACVGKMHTNHEAFHYGYHHRFSKLDYPADIERARREHPPTHDPQDKALFDTVVDTWGKPPRLRGAIAAADGRYEHDGIMTDQSIAFLQRHVSDPDTKSKPFFLHASLTQPHWPWVLPRDFYYMYDPATVDFEPPAPGALDHDAVASRRYYGFGWDKNSEAVHRLARARYYGAVSWLDHNIGRLLNALEDLGVADNTLVLYFTDHGDFAGERGLWLKSLLYDSAARLPMILRYPGRVPAGAVNHTLINHVDLFPTLAGLVGTAGPLPQRISGKDLSASVTSGAPGPEFTIAFD
ncbi:MAG TPA: sulfatase-like hydrolase/transferase, partial [Chloroflexota bacterium]|nr:sulfatase-like hydrolase/transferase [Chloroflexota bacterium]